MTSRLSVAIKECSLGYIRLAEAVTKLGEAIRKYKAYQKRNPLKAKQIIKILKYRL